MKQTIKNNLGLGIIVVLSNLLSLFLVAFRVIYTDKVYFFYLIWNLFLAWVPFILSWYFLLYKHLGHKLVGLIIFLGWLAFLPNTFYIITDFVHLRSSGDIGLWFDLLLIFSFVWNGMFLGVASLNIVHEYYLKPAHEKLSHIGVILILVLSSFGIYLGRFLRWNSWDILTNPGDLVADITERLANPLVHQQTYGVTIFLSIFLLIVYYTVYFSRKSR